MLLLFHNHKCIVSRCHARWCCLELVTTQKCILPSQRKNEPRGASAGGNVGYNMFLIQLRAACARQYVGSSLLWSLCSCMLVFAPNYKDAPLSGPGGAIKARWLPCSDLPIWHFHTPRMHKSNHRAADGSACWEAFFFSGEQRDPSRFPIQWQLCHWLWLLFNVVMCGIPAVFKCEGKWREENKAAFCLNSVRCGDQKCDYSVVVAFYLDFIFPLWCITLFLH